MIFSDKKLLGVYAITDKAEPVFHVEIVGIEPVDHKSTTFYQPLYGNKNNAIGSFIVPNYLVNKIDKGLQVSVKTTTGKKLKIQRLGSRYGLEDLNFKNDENEKDMLEFEKGGEINNELVKKIASLKAVVNSNMIPENIREKAQAQLEKLQEEANTKKEQTAKETAPKPASAKKETKPRAKRTTTTKAPVAKSAPKEKPAIKDDTDFDTRLAALKKKKEYKGKLKDEPIGDNKRRDLRKDAKLPALPPGKRISKDGNVYYESRENRTDVSKKERLGEGGEISASNNSGFGLDFLRNW